MLTCRLLAKRMILNSRLSMHLADEEAKIYCVDRFLYCLNSRVRVVPKVGSWNQPFPQNITEHSSPIKILNQQI